MTLSPAVPLMGLLALVAVYLLNCIKRYKASALPLPPGPKGVPVLGNINDLPKPGGKLECHHWAEHKDLYGQ